MIKLTRVELSNIRSHSHVVFEPESDGITALSGANGTGKSTIVDSIAWALFGTKPHGVSKTAAIYRNGAKFGKDKCFVRLNIEVDDQPLLIERRMVSKSGTAECEVWELTDDGHGNRTPKQVAGPGVSHAEIYIRQRLKMDEKGFLASVLVQQKQVDHLISATPRERALVIEKLTGISSITAALDNARQESNTLRKAAALSDVSEEELNQLRQELEKQAAIFHKTQSIEAKAVTTHDTISAKVNKLRDEIHVKAEQVASMEEIRHGIATLQAKLESMQTTFAMVVEEKEVKKKQLNHLLGNTDLTELESQINGLKHELRSLDIEKSDLERSLKNICDSRSEAQQLVDKSSIKDLDSATTGLDKAVKRVSVLEKQIRTLDSTCAAHLSDIKKLEKAITVLQRENGACPTCLQHVDDVSTVVEKLQTEIIHAQEQVETLRVKRIELEHALDRSETAIEKFELLIDALKVLETQEESTLRENLNNTLTSVQRIETQLTALEDAYNEAKQQASVKAEYDRLLERAQTLSREIEIVEKRLQNGRDKLKSIGSVTPQSLEKLRAVLDKNLELEKSRAANLATARIDLNVAKERFDNLSRQVASYEEQLNKHRAVLKSVELAATTTKVIEEFREDRITNSIPVIEIYASDLLNRFTEGKFTRLKLDAQFKATVMLADGTERAVGLLSGGELSAAAMALRLSISMLLNGGASRNLIILDEVLVSQDANRAELILSTIKEVCQGQVILIAHNDSIDAIADKVVELQTLK